MEEKALIARIRRLYEVRQQILESGEVAPDGCWIHLYEVRRLWRSGFVGVYQYAKWQSSTPVFKRNPKRNGRPPKRGKDPEFSTHQHIGRVSSNTGLGMEPEVEEAYLAVARRDRLNQIDEALKEIETILDRVLSKSEAAIEGYADDNLH